MTSARSATFTAISPAHAAPWSGTPRCRSGSVSATSRRDQGATNRCPRRSTGSRATTRTSTRIARRASCRTEPALPAERRAADDRRHRASPASAGRLRRPLFDTPAADLPHPRKGNGEGRPSCADKRRHFVREEVEACKALHRRRRVPDARGAAAVSRRRRAAPERRREDAGQRGARRAAAAAAPLRSPSPVHRAGARRACGRSGSTSCPVLSARGRGARSKYDRR